MSEEERKGAIEIIRTLYGVHRSEDYQKAFDVIIAALSAEPCEDAISRQAAIEAIYDNKDRLDIAQAIRELPSVTPKQRTGHWILVIEDWNKWTCSECGFSERTDIHVTLGYRFCPKCGAKMESEEQE